MIPATHLAICISGKLGQTGGFQGFLLGVGGPKGDLERVPGHGPLLQIFMVPRFAQKPAKSWTPRNQEP